MNTNELAVLFKAYGNAPGIFHATRYWETYEKHILEAISKMEAGRLRAGEYQVLRTFGFNDVVYFCPSSLSGWKRLIFRWIQKYAIKNRAMLPYGLNLTDLREMAYRQCELAGQLSHASPIGGIEVSEFGAPEDLFAISGRKYTMAFLSYYLRYCFAHAHIGFKGNETLVELGSGSGYQIEVLKKIYPRMTVLCFDLPAQIYLCEKYLSEALGKGNIVGTAETLQWKDLSRMKEGRVHFFGNWQMPLVRGLDDYVFWNAASFGEMEPDVVKNYIAYFAGKAKWVYLLQARKGKETRGENRVETPITFEDYNKWLADYALKEQQDVYQAYKKLSVSGGYFQAVWERKRP